VLPGGTMGFLIVVNLLFFGLAFFLDFFELAFILVPLVGPVAEKLGIDLIWFGVLLGVNMQTSFMHPPFGFALFYLRSVAPKEVTTSDIYWGAVPFVLIQVIMVGLIIVFPDIVSIAEKTDMKEQIELKIDVPSPEEGADGLQLDKQESGGEGDNEAPQLNFSTDEEKK
jgi:TRAP-type mannitol/chloroaromatic compound transport system permease large subunit